MLTEKEKNAQKPRIISSLVWHAVLSIQMLLLGLGSLFVEEREHSIRVLGFALTIIFSFIILDYGFMFIRDRKKFWEFWERMSKINPSFFPSEQDNKNIQLLKKNPSLGLPHLLFTGFMFFLIIEGVKNFLTIVNIMIKTLHFNPFLSIIIYAYTLVFLCFSLHMLGYLSLGEILQRKLSKVKRSFLIELLLDYLYSIPFIAFLSLFWVILFFSQKRKDENLSVSFSDALRRLSLFAILEALRYYIFINLAINAFGDRKTTFSLKESYNFLKEGKRPFAKIWAGSGAMLLPIALMAFILPLWNYKFNFMGMGMTIIIIGLGLGGFFLWRFFSEQVSILLYYIKTRHPEYNLDRLRN